MPAIDSNTLLLLHCDGADASTTFTDSSPSGRTATVGGTAQIDTAQSVFGGASMLLDGNSDYITFPDHADWDFSGDLTIDFRMRLNAAQNGMVAANYASGVGGMLLRYVTGTGWHLYWNQGSVSKEWAWAPSTATWYHVALVRSTNVFNMYIDGSAIGTAYNQATSISAHNSPWAIGYDNASGDFFNGWIDEYRVSNVARWTANFTPPSAAYGMGAGFQAIIL